MKGAMPKTLHLDALVPADLERAAQLLRDGALVAFATETVYGLGANAMSAEAVERIFTAKERPPWDPLIVHLADGSDLDRLVILDEELSARVELMARVFWPGPLTLLLPRRPGVPDAVTAGRRLVGVRVPAHPAAHALLAAAGVPVAAPSANRFGHTSPTTAAHVLADLDGRIEAVLDAGPAAIGLESTVLDPTQTPLLIYRPGAITAEAIERATGLPVAIYDPGPSATRQGEPAALPSPGVGLRHYAPRARLVLAEGSPAGVERAIAQAQLEVGGHAESGIGVLLPIGWPPAMGAVVQPWADWGDLDGLAATLFSGLRALDDAGVSTVVCPLPEPGPGMAAALRDRLGKASRPA